MTTPSCLDSMIHTLEAEAGDLAPHDWLGEEALVAGGVDEEVVYDLIVDFHEGYAEDVLSPLILLVFYEFETVLYGELDYAPGGLVFFVGLVLQTLPLVNRLKSEESILECFFLELFLVGGVMFGFCCCRRLSVTERSKRYIFIASNSRVI